MAWSSPRTWITGEVVTAAIMNTHIRDNELYLYGGGSGTAPSLRLGLTAAQSIPNNTATTVLWNSIGEDTASGYNSGTGIYTVQTGGAGLWAVSVGASWAGNGAGYRGVQIFQNAFEVGSSFINNNPDPGSAYRVTVPTIIRLQLNDTLKAQVTQTSGGALNLNANAPTAMMARWIGA